MELRKHQELALQMCRDSIRSGKKRPIVAAPTSFGKTILAAQMMKNCQDNGKKGWFFCDRINLIDQTIEKFQAFGINFGVRQANHELHDPTAPIQIASIQTVKAMVDNHQGQLPEFDFAMVDECHQQWDLIKTIATSYNAIPIIGLSATPYSKGLGEVYNNLLVPITPRELLDKGYLCPVRYFGGQHVDLSKVKSDNANTYKARDLELETDREKEVLTGCIVKNWIKHGENSQTIAFSPSQNHSKFLVQKLNEAGISAVHIDCYTPDTERRDMFEAHNAGDFKVLSCSRLLNTGYDAPSVRCIIDCFPTKSVTTYVQRVGRIMRICDGKDNAIYLDHAGNFEKFGYAEDIVPESLHDGSKPHREIDQIKKDKKEAKKADCPQCHQLMAGPMCKACGYQVPVKEQMIDDGTILQEITEGTAANKKDSMDAKIQFLSEMVVYAKSKGYKEGFASFQYKEKYGVWPDRNTKLKPVSEVSDLVKGWIKHQNIKKARAKKKGSEVISNLKRMVDE